MKVRYFNEVLDGRGFLVLTIEQFHIPSTEKGLLVPTIWQVARPEN